MLIFLFGHPAVGKNYVGKILETHFNYYFWDADLALLPEMQACIAQKQVFTQDMRDRFMTVIIDKIKSLKNNYDNIVVAQALYKEKNRQQLASAFPEMKFILIEAHLNNIHERLKVRNNAVDIDYTKKIQSEFEIPAIPHKTLINDTNESDIIHQLQTLLVD